MSDPDWDWHCVDFVLARIPPRLRKQVRDRIGRPASAAEVASAYRALGVTNLKEAVSVALDRPPVGPEQAMRGDVVMVDNALGICRGDLVEFMDRMQPISRAECAWRIRKRWS